jgi:hypothetical protein
MINTWNTAMYLSLNSGKSVGGSPAISTSFGGRWHSLRVDTMQPEAKPII